MDYCVHHEDKTAFELFRRYLVRSKILPKDLSSRLAMAVCSCRKKRSTKIDPSDEEVVKMREDIRMYVKNMAVENIKPSSTLQLVHNIISRDTDLSRSEINLTYILHQALQKDFTLLESEQQDNWKKMARKDKETKNDREDRNEDDENADETKYTMTMRQIRFMVKKRKRKMPVSSRIDVPVHGDNLYLLTRKTGREFKDLAQRFKCYFEIDWATTNHNIAAGVPLSSFKVWCRTQDVLADIKSYFDRLMASKEFASHKLMAQEHAWKNDYRCRNCRPIQMNYRLTDHFTEKVLGRKKLDNRCVTSRQRVKSLPSALSSVICERCLQSYSDVLVQNRPCYFHPTGRGTEPGDGSERTWPCCDVADQGLSLVEEHHSTGCWEGTHIWNVADVITTPANHNTVSNPKPRRKPNWAVVGYVMSF